jgi:hypothetical protein
MLATIQSRAFCLLVCCQKNLKMRIYKTIILPVVMYSVRNLVSDTKGGTQSEGV